MVKIGVDSAKVKIKLKIKVKIWYNIPKRNTKVRTVFSIVNLKTNL